MLCPLQSGKTPEEKVCREYLPKLFATIGMWHKINFFRVELNWFGI